MLKIGILLSCVNSKLYLMAPCSIAVLSSPFTQTNSVQMSYSVQVEAIDILLSIYSITGILSYLVA